MPKPRTSSLIVILSVLLTAASAAVGELTVIYAHPDSRPMTDFLAPRPSPRHAPAAAPTIPSGVLDPRRLLPIRSPGLSPGPVTSRTLTLPIVQPLFLIGADDLSKAWLAGHRSRLEALGAVGMLVEAEVVADLEAIAELAGNLPIIPASGADIARALGLTHYPVCIGANRIWQ